MYMYTIIRSYLATSFMILILSTVLVQSLPALHLAYGLRLSDYLYELIVRFWPYSIEYSCNGGCPKF